MGKYRRLSVVNDFVDWVDGVNVHVVASVVLSCVSFGFALAAFAIVLVKG